ncbi:hypothetical protein KI387_021365, partial [Taxus chinensis]
VLNVCRAISRAGMPFRSMVVTGGFKWKTQRENLEKGTDILIATPGRFCFLLQEEEMQLSNLFSIVLDEVDILFDDEDFSLALDKLMSSAPLVAQYLFVTATLPLDVHNKLLEKFPDCKAILGPRLHRTCSGLEERALTFINVDHVVLFDFPRDPSEYVRRVGRTARGAGGRGKAFVFVVGKQVSAQPQRIIDRNEKGQPLHVFAMGLIVARE